MLDLTVSCDTCSNYTAYLQQSTYTPRFLGRKQMDTYATFSMCCTKSTSDPMASFGRVRVYPSVPTLLTPDENSHHFVPTFAVPPEREDLLSTPVCQVRLYMY